MSAFAAASTHSHGASMSRMTRSTSVSSRHSTKSPTTSRQRPTGPSGSDAVEPLHVLPRHLGEIRPPLVGGELPALPDRPQQEAGQRAGADPRLDHPRAREDVGHARRSGPRPWGRSPPRRAAWTACSRAAGAGTRCRGCRWRSAPPIPPGWPISSSCGIDALVRVEDAALAQRHRVPLVLGVGELDLIPRPERPVPAKTHAGSLLPPRSARTGPPRGPARPPGRAVAPAAARVPPVRPAAAGSRRRRGTW